MPNAKMEMTMFRHGYVLASRAADLAMVDANGTIYRRFETGDLKGVKSGTNLWITLASLLALYSANPVVEQRIKAWRPSILPVKKHRRRTA